MIFMVTGSLPLATATLDFIDPALTQQVVLSAAIASAWFLAIAVVLIIGIEVTSRVQMVMTGIELVILTAVAIGAFVHAGRFGAINVVSRDWFGFGYSLASFANTALVVVFF